MPAAHPMNSGSRWSRRGAQEHGRSRRHVRTRGKRGAEDELCAVVRATCDVATDVVGVVRLELRWPRHMSVENDGRETWGEPVQLALDGCGGVSGVAVWHMRIRPQRVLDGRYSRWIENRRLHHQHE